MYSLHPLRMYSLHRGDNPAWLPFLVSPVLVCERSCPLQNCGKAVPIQPSFFYICMYVHICVEVRGQPQVSCLLRHCPPCFMRRHLSLTWYLSFTPGITKLPNFLCVKQTLDGPSDLCSPRMFLLAYLTLHCHLFVYIFCHLRRSHLAVEACILILALFFYGIHHDKKRWQKMGIF